MSIRRKASQIMDTFIEEGGWDEVFDRKDTVGQLDDAVRNQLIKVLLETVEFLENEVSVLSKLPSTNLDDEPKDEEED